MLVIAQGESLADEDLDETKFYPLINAASAPAAKTNSSDRYAKLGRDVEFSSSYSGVAKKNVNVQ